MSETVEFQAPVEIQLVHADGEQLLEFAREVLVRSNVAFRIGLGISKHAQIQAHDRMLGDLFQKISVIAEGVFTEHVVVTRHAKLGVGKIG